jgi:hypothetical protein
MKNQIAASAARTSGYGNSWGEAAGQKAYQDTLQQLNDKAVERYSDAITKWQNEYDNLQQQLGIASDMKQQADTAHQNEIDSALQNYNTVNDLYSEDWGQQHTKWSDENAAAQADFTAAQDQYDWVLGHNADEVNNANTLNLSAWQSEHSLAQEKEQADAELAERIRHNRELEKIKKNNS